MKDDSVEVLKRCLTDSRVHATIQEHFTADPPGGFGMQSLSDFVNFVKIAAYEEELEALVKKVTGFADSNIEVARMRAAWRVASSTIKATESKQATGTKHCDLDDPLDTYIADDLQTRWDARYPLLLHMMLCPSDSLVGRVYREIKRNTATVISMQKVKSLHMAQQPFESQSIPVGDATLETNKPVETPITGALDYYFRMRTLSYAYIKAGNFMVKSVAVVGKEVLYSPFTINLDYPDLAARFVATANLPYNFQVEWLRTKDEMTRSTMVGYMRQGWPQGEALSQALREHQMDWKQTTPPTTGTKRPAPESGKLAAVADTYQGKEICKKRNDNRGCTANEKDCPMKKRHVCDIVLPGGKVCGATSHTRKDCPYRVQ